MVLFGLVLFVFSCLWISIHVIKIKLSVLLSAACTNIGGPKALIFSASTESFDPYGLPVIPLNQHFKPCAWRGTESQDFLSKSPSGDWLWVQASFCLSRWIPTLIIPPHLLTVWPKPPWWGCFKDTLPHWPAWNWILLEWSCFFSHIRFFFFMEIWGIGNSSTLRMHVFMFVLFKRI